jgi:hypothetical protein
MLSAILQKVTGQKVIDYLTPRLFLPLEIQGMTWETCPRGINTGGWGLALETEALAKFGQFYLQNGAWNGRQLLPTAWIADATTFKIQQPAAVGTTLEEEKKKSEWHQGYCYQFWRCRHNFYRGDGAMGQYTIIMPDRDAVIAITSETASMAGEMNLIWDHLLPAMKENKLPADKHAQAQLKKTLASLALLPPDAGPASPLAAGISGKVFKVDANDLGIQSVSFDFRHGKSTFTARDRQGEYPIVCGTDKWVKTETSMPGTPPKLTPADLRPVKVAACGTWKDDNTFQMIWRFYTTPHHDTVTCRFEDNRVKVEFVSSIAEKMPARKEKPLILQGQMIV